MRFTDNSYDGAVSTLALDVLPEIEQVVSEMNRVTRPGGIVASAVHQFLGGMTAFDLVINTAAVLDASTREVRDALAGRQQFWPDGQAALWRKMGLVDVAEIPVVVDCEYPSFADYWATFTSRQGIVSRYLMALSDDVQKTVQEHVRGGYLLRRPDGPRSFPMMFRACEGGCRTDGGNTAASSSGLGAKFKNFAPRDLGAPFYWSAASLSVRDCGSCG
jgi:hypothetical protein